MYLLSGATSLHHLAIGTKPSLSCLLCFLCMLAIPIFPFLEFLVYLSRLLFYQTGIIVTRVHVYLYTHVCYYPNPHPLSLSPPLFPHCSITMRFVTKKVLIRPFSSMYIHVYTCFYCYILTFSNVMTVYIFCIVELYL